MSRKRNIIQEIEEIRERGHYNTAISELSLRLSELERAFESYDKSQHELTRYFPVAIIACIEAYFRLVIKDLIDAGDPFLSNAENLPSVTRLDFSMLRAIHGKEITVGELVAHGVQLSRFEHIDSAISDLLGKSFLAAIRTATNRWAHEIKDEPSAPILSNPNEVFSDVVRTFELRHIICHEIASAYLIEYDEISQCFASCVTFLRASNELISETIHPGSPLTQTAMNKVAGESLTDAKDRLRESCNELRLRLNKTELVAFDESQDKWQSYCDAWALFVAGEQENGGTIWPLIYAGAAQSTVERRLVEVGGWRRLSDPV